MELKTKSQMIMRIAELSEENTSLKEENEMYLKQYDELEDKYFKLSEENSSLKDEIADLEDLAAFKTKEYYKLKEKHDKLKDELNYKYDEMNNNDFKFMGESLQYWKNLKEENTLLKLAGQLAEESLKLSSELTKELRKQNEKLKNMINKPVFLPNIEEQVTNKIKEVLDEE